MCYRRPEKVEVCRDELWMRRVIMASRQDGDLKKENNSNQRRYHRFPLMMDNDLISLVQERVALWDTRQHDHSDTVVLRRQWNEVAKELMDEWDNATPRARKDFLTKVRTRGRSIKDSLRHESKAYSGSGGGAARLRKYKYHPPGAAPWNLVRPLERSFNEQPWSSPSHPPATQQVGLRHKLKNRQLAQAFSASFFNVGSSRPRQKASDRTVMPEFLQLSSVFQDGMKSMNSNSLENVGFHNQTPFTYFIILGISQVPELQALVFLLVLILYLITVTGNMTLLLLVCLEHYLHTPMYFFLGNLSCLDVFCLTITLHKILLSYMSGDKTVSFTNCMSQMYIFSSLTCNELLILTAMSYDRYVAICNPLHYHMIMNRKICVLLATVCWVLGFVEVIPHMLAISRLSCYKSNEINHYFCDILPIMELSCSDTTLLRLIIFIEGLFLVSFIPLLLTFISYVFIIITILRIRSSLGRRKAFYTCSSHLTVVIILYVSLICQYLRPSSTDTLDSNKLFSLFNTAAVPVLNPFIYSLKNKDVKSAARKQLKWLTS
ncbi:olfactory receptor 6C1-like [Dendrobates tinctorius]|uniref:olfactory receptor 6C1-like n=1 Tax=Dendrobates tinctorius TaxID=92724 RepID=UPI003CC922CC